MASPKPCCGYPSRTAAVMALDAQGFSNLEIAGRLGLAAERVGAVRAAARNYARYKKAQLRLELEPRVLGALLHQARMRGLPLDTLATRLFAAIAEDNLFDAVLDDEASG